MFAFKLDSIIHIQLLILEGLITLTKVNQALILNKIARAPITRKRLIRFLLLRERMYFLHYASLMQSLTLAHCTKQNFSETDRVHFSEDNAA